MVLDTLLRLDSWPILMSQKYLSTPWLDRFFRFVSLSGRAHFYIGAVLLVTAVDWKVGATLTGFWPHRS